MRKTENRKRDNSLMRKGAYLHGAILIALNVLVVAMIMSGCTKDVIDLRSPTEVLIAAGIEETFPPISAESVEVNPVIGVIFLPDTDPSSISSATLTLKNGNNSIAGKMAISGNTALFTYDHDLTPLTEYTATLKTGGNKGSGDDSHSEYTWNFKTGTEHQDNSLSVVSVNPPNKTKDVTASTALIITVNREIKSWMKAFTSVVLKSGSTSVAGSLSFSGKVITFDPSLDLTPGAVYTGEFIYRVKTWNDGGDDGDDDGDHDGDDDDDKSGTTYSWSFTIAGGVIINHDTTPPSVSSVNPANNAASVAVNSKVTATFNEAMSSSSITSATFSLKLGNIAVAGSVTYSGNIATFAPAAALAEGKTYTATVTTGAKDAAGNALAANYTWSFTTITTTVVDVTPPTVKSVVPAANGTSVAADSKVSVTFSEAMNSATITAATFTLKQGNTAVGGTVGYSASIATFSPSSALAPNTIYSATVTTAVKDAAGNALAANYTWSFTTASTVVVDVTPPTVKSVVPAVNGTSVATNSKVSVTFSEAMNSATITTGTFTLKQGNTAVGGTVAYSASVATFTPSAALAGSTIYTATVTTGAKDAAGNALAANYTWSFTTAAPVVTDVTPPKVNSVTPGVNAASVAVNSKVTVTFSEAMNSTTITTASINLKQGNTVISGTVSYSGNVATFTPSAALAGGTVYTATVTTAVKDAAGNALAAIYTWNFTTITVATALSFANDVIPVLAKCNNCHNHGWTTSSNASTYYTNLVNGGYVNPTTYTSSKIYDMINGGHASSISTTDKNKILNWMKEGSKNN